ncbi:hemin uptake protein HemP [Ramlibacter sp. AW1]|uniref:Hemin uptake protein HemP n=1 Tax=Ramlibacter aurantiacus TaxID=2801330 RepID=A0A936ZKM4_9BURK|nr:hemin uptake protein HemP [Ramlibacter aurantiacus]MBL0419446.1 hemin uptake protein HemP [Ramlibacter aurantiacus]
MDRDRPQPPQQQQAPEHAAAPRPPLIHSTELLRGHPLVEISHNGVLYRLQATRQGKLILTK